MYFYIHAIHDQLDRSSFLETPSFDALLSDILPFPNRILSKVCVCCRKHYLSPA